MELSKTVKLLTAAVTADVSTAAAHYGGAYRCRRMNRGTGIVQVQCSTSGDTYTVYVQGRADANAAWAGLASITNADEVAHGTNTTAIKTNVPLMPEMRLVVNAVSASATINAWLVE